MKDRKAASAHGRGLGDASGKLFFYSRNFGGSRSTWICRSGVVAVIVASVAMVSVVVAVRAVGRGVVVVVVIVVI